MKADTPNFIFFGRLGLIKHHCAVKALFLFRERKTVFLGIANIGCQKLTLNLCEAQYPIRFK